MEESLYTFVNKTNYDRNALAALNDLAEKSVSKKKSQSTRILSLVGGVACLVLGVTMRESSGLASTLFLVYGVLLLLACISWRSLRLKSSQRQMKHGGSLCTYGFDEEGIFCQTDTFSQTFPYDQVFAVVMNDKWYAIFFDANHGIIMNRKGFTEGDDLSFKAYIGQHTQLPIQEF